MVSGDTIVALSSGGLPSGVAVVRASGPACANVLGQILAKPVLPLRICLREIFHPARCEVIDRGFVCWFPGPASFTGEDVFELHLHGSRAVVSVVLEMLCSVEGVRLAEAGEFTRRGFENGKLDLTEVDGISDLVASETDAQRRLAFSQSQGSLRSLYEKWRGELVFVRAMIEAAFDFSDEEDIPTDISDVGYHELNRLISEIRAHGNDGRAGEIIRDGYRVTIIGPPNVGKSSLLNALSERDVAIVSDVAGTTRDVLEVRLDIAGYVVIFSDTAGIRSSKDSIEQEGIRRALTRADESDLLVVLVDDDVDPLAIYSGDTDRVVYRSKDDEGLLDVPSLSSKTGYGLDVLLADIRERLSGLAPTGSSDLITRSRYRVALQDALGFLESARCSEPKGMELRAEDLRLAGDCIGRITGKIDVEDLLDVIFAEFCIGK